MHPVYILHYLTILCIRSQIHCPLVIGIITLNPCLGPMPHRFREEMARRGHQKDDDIACFCNGIPTVPSSRKDKDPAHGGKGKRP